MLSVMLVLSPLSVPLLLPFMCVLPLYVRYILSLVVALLSHLHCVATLCVVFTVDICVDILVVLMYVVVRVVVVGLLFFFPFLSFCSALLSLLCAVV